MTRRTKTIIGVAVLAFVVGGPVLTHERAKWRVEQYRRQLRASGEKLNVQDLVPTLSPEALKGGNDLLAALSHFRSTSPDFRNQAPAMKFIAPGKALVAWEEAVLPIDQNTNVWPALSAEVSSNRVALEELRLAAQEPALSFQVDYSQAVTMPAHLSRLKGAASWLSAAAELELHEGRLGEAWTNIALLSAIVGKYHDEPMMISELVRIAIAASAVIPTWEGLQAPGLSDQQLAEVQQSWESTDFLAHAEAALAFELATVERMAAYVRSLPMDYYRNLIGGAAEDGFLATLKRKTDRLRWDHWQSYDDEVADLQLVKACLDAVRQSRKEGEFTPALRGLDTECERLLQAHPMAGALDELGSVRGGHDALAEGFKDFVKRNASIELRRALLVTAVTLKRYQLKHGAYPAELESLKPEFLREVPHDPMDGKPLRYRLNPDGSFLLYSVGDDGVDNGGDPTPSSDSGGQWVHARDAVWPQPATPQKARADLEKVVPKR